MKRFVLIALLGLGACADGPAFLQPAANVKPADSVVTTPPPPPDARTEDAFDTTTDEERAAAVAIPEPAGERSLGTTVATLGSPTEPGIWMETPLVSSVTQGRVEAENGKSVSLELRPIDGPATAGSRISLPALRLLEVGLAGLHTLTVYAK
ncbi:D-galactarate dehydratase [Maritimibacter sp. UBA3975]|uniref:D-galactarate dehydratase n=1 Tax=Maritimibacter sp. UBA3975 TaxID=1946833 RepID=UPI000C08DC48|nr:D-galactarate dehydratase [Maritimibacter sp. UBA3975]MAM60980.1 D-galactarate dehydratase [Maritimibacter sp.]|tara:strand:+ start:30932 stop:31387 length:456 start_codon:yes stop_codon:yes gene_type:complete